jgi:hypothetical protein
MNTSITISLKKQNEGQDNDMDVMNMLLEFAKISPDLYLELHQNNTLLISKQGNQEIVQFRGNAP